MNKNRLPNDWELDDGRVITLITPKEAESIDDSTYLVDIEGTLVTMKEIRRIGDFDTRFGYMAYGFPKNE